MVKAGSEIKSLKFVNHLGFRKLINWNLKKYGFKQSHDDWQIN